MKDISKKAYEISDSELDRVAGGAGGEYPMPKYPIGTEVLETEFSQSVGQDRGFVIAYGWPEDGKYSYIIKWDIHGEKKYTEERVERFRMCWELTYG